MKKPLSKDNPGKRPGLRDRESKKALYLRNLRRLNGAMVLAAEATGIHHNTVWEWRKRDADFEAAYQAVLDRDTEGLEREARRRAMRKSDILAIFLLKARKPLVYRDNVPAAQVTVTLGDLLRGARQIGQQGAR